MIKLGEIKVPKTNMYPYKFNKKTFANEKQLTKYVNLAYAMGGYLPQWDKRKLVEKSEWKNEDRQTFHDLEVIAAMAKPKKVKRKSSSSKETIYSNIEKILKEKEYDGVVFIEKVGLKVSSPTHDHVIKVVEKKVAVENPVEYMAKRTKANEFKLLIISDLLESIKDSLNTSEGVLLDKKFIVKITRKTSRL